MFKYSTISGPVAVAGLALTLALGACSSGGDGTAMMPDPDPMPTPHICETGTAQQCADARQSELAALEADGTATVAQLNAARMALAEAQTALAEANAAAARKALVDAAAMCTDGTQACVDAHQALVDALAADSTTSVGALAAARANLAAVQMAKADADAAANAAATRQMLVDAAACTDGTQACVDAHQALVDALEADNTTSEEDLAAARTALGNVQMAKADADAEAARMAAEAAAAAARQALVDAAASCTEGTAECVKAHQDLVDALDDDPSTSADDLAAARTALGNVQMAKADADAEAARRMAEMNAAEARQALIDAAACTDATEACRDAHQALVDALQGDLDTVNADPDATNAQVDAAEMALAAATTARDTVQTAIDEAAAAARAAAALQALADAAAMCTDGTAACVSAHQMYVDALEADDTTSDADLAAARMALGNVQTALSNANAAAARQMLADAAAACTDGTAECLAAHDALIAAIQGDLDALEADDNATQAQIRAKQAELQAAMDESSPVRMALADANAAAARQMLEDAAACMDATQACVDAHDDWVEVLEDELAELNDDDTSTLAQIKVAENAVADAKEARTNVQMALDDTTAVDEAITAATDAIGELDDDSTAEEVEAARNLVMAAQTALDDADNLSTEDMASLQGMIDAIDTSDLETQETRVAEAKTEATTTAAGTKRDAIEAEAEVVAADDDGLGGDGAAPTTGQLAGEYNLMIAWDDETDAQSISIVIETSTDADDNETVTMNDMGMLVRTHDADDDGNVVEEVAIIHTDIEAPKATAFGMVHSLDVRVDGETATDEMPNDARNVVTGDLSHVKAAAFKAPAGTVSTTTLTFQQAVADDAGTTDVDESRDAAEIAGTYQGAMGTYKCNAAAAACTVTVNTEGVVSGVSTDNDWIFIPADGATVDVADADYLHYGFWLQKTTDEDGVVKYDEVQTFAGSSVDPSGDVASVTGKATYKGGAAGVYVRETYKTTDGSVDVATSGHFTADVSLTAHFGQTVDDTSTTDVNEAGQLPPNLLNTLTGTIDNFVLSGGEGNTWSVALQSDGDLTAVGIQGQTTGTMSGTASGGVTGQLGSFTATYHGSVTAVDGVTPKPSSVVGEFNSSFRDGLVAGAFGAREQ